MFVREIAIPRKEEDMYLCAHDRIIYEMFVRSLTHNDVLYLMMMMIIKRLRFYSRMRRVECEQIYQYLQLSAVYSKNGASAHGNL